MIVRLRQARPLTFANGPVYLATALRRNAVHKLNRSMARAATFRSRTVNQIHAQDFAE